MLFLKSIVMYVVQQMCQWKSEQGHAGTLTVSAYITLAPPPATIVHIRPLGFNTVNFKDALVCNVKART